MKIQCEHFNIATETFILHNPYATLQPPKIA